MTQAAHYVELMFFRALAELRAEASRMYLGFLWWVLEPLLFMAVFYFVFKAGLRRGDADFLPFLLSGLLAWKWFSSSVQVGANAVSKNAAMIQQVYIPKYILPGIVLVSNSFKFLFVFLVCVPIWVWVLDRPVTVAWFALPAVMLVQFIFTAGVISIVSAVVPFVPDLRMLIGNVIMLLLFASGIFFDIEATPDPVRRILLLNPVALVLQAYRHIMMDHAWPDPGRIAIILLWGLGCLAAGMWVFVRYDRTYPKLVKS